MTTKRKDKEIRENILEVLGDYEPHSHEDILLSVSKDDKELPLIREAIQSMIARGDINLTNDWKLRRPRGTMWNAAATRDPLLDKLDMSVLRAPLTEEQKQSMRERIEKLKARQEEDLKAYRNRVNARRCRHCGRRDP